MNITFHKVKVYAKLSLIALIGVYLILFILLNLNHVAEVNFLFASKQVNVALLIPITGVLSVAAFLAAKAVRTVLTELRRSRKTGDD